MSFDSIVLLFNLRTVTIRLIRSFEHRNIRNLVLKDTDPQCNIGEFKTTVRKGEVALYTVTLKTTLHQL